MKEKLVDEVLAKSLVLEVGDNEIAWIDSFGSNTAQGGYETLCVIEASVKKGKELNASFNDLYFMSDAGSGYKTGQSIAGVRNLKQITGVNVRHWHFNASGEGTRWETDGHNTDINCIRESAMRAGCPCDCMTPDKEAQSFDGGIEGSFPVLLDFGYDEVTPMKKSWEGIQGYHNFEFLDNGGVRAWKSYKIGEGKGMQ